MTTLYYKYGRRFVSLLLILSVSSLGLFFHMNKAMLKTEWINYTRDMGLVLENVAITGHHKTTRSQIQSVLDIDQGMPLVSMDLGAIRKRIEELPWVEQVALKRRYPNTLDIQIQERIPMALWQSEGVVSLVDEAGFILTRKNLESYTDLLLIVGENAHRNIAEISKIIESQAHLSSFVRSAVHVGNRRWDIHFMNGMRLRLPETTDQQEALSAMAHFAELQKSYDVLSREISVIDLRSDKVILKLTPKGKRMMRRENIYS
ncbi:FtsQ-type POTRA domain-containing protein [Temperatibacter marinus]|uniref:Cell division protein FtsQ n=1 Tax=Temperatibacter marinus TaxID=1456591 RepID=A0AA52H8L9_9PROT|nr:FtsQ-type POTRA domain-containing protein [Temperatibacter marinus]WND01597.1 FtsQ-type POTRA domain-containing protein [Temperatibacter marinus]